MSFILFFIHNKKKKVDVIIHAPQVNYRWTDLIIHWFTDSWVIQFRCYSYYHFLSRLYYHLHTHYKVHSLTFIYSYILVFILSIVLVYCEREIEVDDENVNVMDLSVRRLECPGQLLNYQCYLHSDNTIFTKNDTWE